MERARASWRRLSFGARAMLGYLVVVLLLAAGMVLTVRQLDAVSVTQLARVRAEESQITLTERLRWTGEVIVSSGRAYLITGNHDLLAKLREAEDDFEESVRALRAGAASGLIVNVERAATRFTDKQEQLIEARRSRRAPEELAASFENELMPLRRELAEALEGLVEQKHAAIDEAYRQAEMDRARLAVGLYLLLGVLVLMGLAAGWYFARELAHSYREEESAHEAARRALVARDELMGIVAHDLRNPLGAIVMKAALLGKLADRDALRAQAESIENIGMRMESLIKTMLDVATLEAGRFSLTTTPCNVADLLHEALDLFAGLAASKQIRIERHVRDAGLVVVADRERALQVFSNLLGNAVKHTSPGGLVTVSVARQDGMVRFEISDTGPGISSDDIPHLFDRFWKREAPGGKGTGLGLFIAKGIVEAHGGRIWVASEAGRGATFFFTVPLAAEHASSTVPAEAVPAHV